MLEVYDKCAQPIIIGAGVVEVPKLLHTDTAGLLQVSLLGGVTAGIAAYLSVWVLIQVAIPTRYRHAPLRLVLLACRAGSFD